ncbi:4-alpha-glucanotransferase [Aurantiacibacter zhengii]|uniref:4-alpha-glucanotransferase n=1 Tax=Aurantiacibacter zhengii TaxID=2307003 RepID=A0A418NST2_9SPHN|nr:4-alpha-glucanotransferase [Aurantiacibacter zhengii]RIV86002.1 4-alpha-glucanotransferase [Aurantiacibacter zhengii]
MGDAIEPLHALAEAAGLQRHWRDVDGHDHVVPDETLIRVLAALGHKAESRRQVDTSLEALLAEREALPTLLVADAGQPIALTRPCDHAEITLPQGETVELHRRDGMPVAPIVPGYYGCRIDGTETRLAVAPPHCPQPPSRDHRRWGVSLQIPSLRAGRASPFGTFGELADAVETLAAAGADAAAINPVHALFPGNGKGFSPYSPSSRRFLNGAMADPALLGLTPLPDTKGGPLIDWESALPERLAQLRALFGSLPHDTRAHLIGEPDRELVLHAMFDALDCRFRSQGANGWREWPARYRKPDSKAVARFAAEHADEVDFHLFVQALAREGLATVQARAKAAGMATGLIGDLAVGVDPGGSDCWALGDVMLRGLTIGAPPDPLGPHGQNWAITSFSPDGLRRTGYAPWIAMIRSALAYGGGLRIDHAFGLARLWVIPEGGGPGDGAYLAYPFDDLIRILTLEAHLADAFVIAEDLGTAPHGFSAAIAQRRLLGMRVLWFERASDDGFIGAQDYDRLAAAMTGTHDTPTLAGWWTGNDIDWADRLGRLPAGIDRAKAEEIRDWDRGLLWSTVAGQTPRPAPHEPRAAVDAAIAHIARTPSALAIVPVEDLLGLVEQPNIPGTVTEHPNWRRRLDAALDTLLATPEAATRLALLEKGGWSG